MEISKDDVRKKKLDYIPIQEFIDRFEPPLKKTAVDYLIKHDKIDYMRPGNERLIVLTKKTLSYEPINYGERKSKNKDS